MGRIRYSTSVSGKLNGHTLVTELTDSIVLMKITKSLTRHCISTHHVKVEVSKLTDLQLQFHNTWWMPLDRTYNSYRSQVLEEESVMRLSILRIAMVMITSQSIVAQIVPPEGLAEDVDRDGVQMVSPGPNETDRVFYTVLPAKTFSGGFDAWFTQFVSLAAPSLGQTS